MLIYLAHATSQMFFTIIIKRPNKGGFFYMVKIFIDPGHGGSDPGAVANGLREKDICLAIALKLQDVLKRKYVGHQLKFSRTTDKTVALKERTDMANNWNADYLVSIHVNAGGGVGFESYIYRGKYANKDYTKGLQRVIHKEIIRVTKFSDRGEKEANFHMLRESRMPAILTENGFIDSVNDVNHLKETKFLQKIANAHARGIAKALSLQEKSTKQGIDYSKGHDAAHKYHVVQKGDTLWSLAQKYGTTVNQLMKWNQKVVPEYLQIGQRLMIARKESGGNGMYHTIEKGDTLWKLALTYGTTVARLLELNIGIDPKRLRIGQKIQIK